MEIDHKLKQRLVGAAVITSLAAIFIPMLFDDPVDESRQAIRGLTIPKAPVEVFETSPLTVPKSTNQVLKVPEPEIVKQKSPQIKPLIKEQKKQPVKSPALVRWVIQVGSFGEKKNAEALRDKLRKQGFNAFVELNNSKLYRVRVGPELDKKRAERTKARLEKINNIKSILVSE
jgi:DedD protein